MDGEYLALKGRVESDTKANEDLVTKGKKISSTGVLKSRARARRGVLRLKRKCKRGKKILLQES